MAKRSSSSRSRPGSRARGPASRPGGPGKPGHRSGPKRKPAGPRRPAADNANAESGERLQKILAAAGFGSRRACEQLILEGRVEVDRRVVTELGAKADLAAQEVRVDGEPLKKQRPVYYAAYKPRGVVSTSADPDGRPRVTDLVPNQIRVFTVGRLDRESEGLVLLTNDGELANRLTHPRHGIEKLYQVQVAGVPEIAELRKLRDGVYLAEGFAKVKQLNVLKRHKLSTWLEMTLDEGRNREIRRVLARLGHKVQHLKRVAIGTLRLGDMQPGDYRPLSRQEIRDLKQLVAAEGKRPPAEPNSNRPKADRPNAGRSTAGVPQRRQPEQSQREQGQREQAESVPPRKKPAANSGTSSGTRPAAGSSTSGGSSRPRTSQSPGKARANQAGRKPAKRVRKSPRGNS